jgi:hypothetical protein
MSINNSYIGAGFLELSCRAGARFEVCLPFLFSLTGVLRTARIYG